MPALFEKLHAFHRTLIASLAWVFILGNVVFITGLWASLKPSTPMGLDSLATLGFFVSVCLVLFCATVLLVAWLCHGIWAKPMLALVVLCAACIAYFQQQFGTVVDAHMLNNLLQTSPQEARDLLSIELFLHLAILVLPPWVLIWQTPRPISWAPQLKSFVLLHALCILIMALLLAASSAQYASWLRNQKELRLDINPLYTLLSTKQWLNKKAGTAWQTRPQAQQADVQ